MTDIKEIKKIINDAERIVFFGGAGVSTESGIPDFRSADGLYADDGSELGMRPEDILSARCLYDRPDVFYRYYRGKMLYPDAVPNAAHYALARLEKMGKLTAVITQNIDGLHQMAGSKRVIELHGSVLKNYCVNCGREYSLDYILDSDGVPVCESCRHFVRPDVVMYGESLPTGVFYEAEEAIIGADVLIVGGTSLTVHPAASLVQYFEGEHLIIINKSPTPYDEYAEYVVRDSVADVLAALVD